MNIDVKYILQFIVCVKYSMLSYLILLLVLFVHYLYLILKL